MNFSVIDEIINMKIYKKDAEIENSGAFSICGDKLIADWDGIREVDFNEDTKN